MDQGADDVVIDRVIALGQFLRYLAGGPELGDAPVRALVEGALSPLACIAGNLYLSDNAGSLVLAGSHGFSEDEIADFRVVSLSLPYPLTRAFLSRVAVRTHWIAVEEEYPLLEPGRSASAAAAAQRRVSGRDLVAVPLLWQGVCLGVVGAVLPAEPDWSRQDDDYLDAVLSALALWIAGRPETTAPAVPQRAARLGRQLTPRQLEVLRLMAAGKSNAGMAAALGYSTSTVKADIAGILSTLGVHDRASAVAIARSLGMLEG